MDVTGTAGGFLPAFNFERDEPHDPKPGQFRSVILHATDRPSPVGAEALEQELRDAAQAGDVDRLKRVLAAAPSFKLDARDPKNYKTALHYAATADTNRNEVVQLLIDAGADITLLDNDNKNAYQLAAEAAEADHDNPDGTNQKTPFILREAATEKLKEVLKQPRDPNGPDRGYSGYTYDTVKINALLRAGAEEGPLLTSKMSLHEVTALKNAPNIAKGLIKNGADLTELDSLLTPYASVSHYAEDLTLSDGTVRKGMDEYKQLKKIYQDAAKAQLQEAFKKGDWAKAAKLARLDTGIDPKARYEHAGEDNVSLLSFAAGAGQLDVVKALVEKVPAGKERTDFINAKGSRGRTALHSAADTGSPEVYRYLANEQNGDINIKDDSGKTPKHYFQTNSLAGDDRFNISFGEGYVLPDLDDPLPSIRNTSSVQIPQAAAKDHSVLRYTLHDGRKFIVSRQTNPDHFDAADRTRQAQVLMSQGAVLLEPHDFAAVKDMQDLSAPADNPRGMFTFKKGGKTYIVLQEINPVVYGNIETHRLSGQEDDRNTKYSGLNILEKKTKTEIKGAGNSPTYDKDGNKQYYTVAQLTLKKLFDDYGDITDANDPRFKFMQAALAIPAAQDGMEFTAFVEDVRWEGAHTSRTEPKGGRKSRFTSSDMLDIIDAETAFRIYEETFKDPQVQADYRKFEQEAIKEVDGADEIRAGLRAVIKEPKEFVGYIDGLRKSGKTELAEEEVQNLIMSAQALLPQEEVEDAVLSITTGASISDMNAILSDPEKIDSANYGKAVDEYIAMLLRVTSYSIHAPRRLMETLHALHGANPDQVAETFKKLSAELQKSGNGVLTEASLDRALSGLPDKIDRQLFRTTFYDLHKAGLLGSSVALISLAAGTLQLTGRSGPKAEGQDGLISGGEYSSIAAARNFLVFGALNTEFAEMFGAGMKLLKQPGAIDSLGLSKTIPEVWGKDGVLKDAYVRGDGAAAQILDDAGSELNMRQPLDAPAPGGVDARNSANGYVKRAAKRLGKVFSTSVLGATVGTVMRVTEFISLVGVGVLDVVLGALSIRGNIEGGSSSGGLQIASGLFTMASGIAEGKMNFKPSRLTRVIQKGSLFFSYILAFAGLVGGIAISDQDDRFDAQLEWFQNLAKAGLLQKDWGDKLEYAMYSDYHYGGREAREDVSIFDYQWREYQHFRKTGQHKGSSSNRLNSDLRFDADDRDWMPAS